jgi:hypothetical protein
MTDPNNPIVIPQLPDDGSIWLDDPVVGQPGWWKVVGPDKKPRKPLIRCNCGYVSGIRLHHVHADGRVTASYYHKRGNSFPEDPKGCEWHVFLKLDGWDGGDIPPDAKSAA